MDEKPDLAGLVGSRICHDVIGPIGAIGNGVELMMLAPGTASPELALIADSVAQANARIRFFRIAYGPAAADQRITRGEVASVLDALTARGRLQVKWDSANEVSRPEARLAFLLFQCLEAAMPHGGRVTIKAGGQDWRMIGTGPRMKHDPALWSDLAGGRIAPGIGPSDVHFALAVTALDGLGRKLLITTGEESIRLDF